MLFRLFHVFCRLFEKLMCFGGSCVREALVCYGDFLVYFYLDTPKFKATFVKIFFLSIDLLLSFSPNAFYLI